MIDLRGIEIRVLFPFTLFPGFANSQQQQQVSSCAEAGVRRE
jgi:hypothetical protein